MNWRAVRTQFAIILSLAAAACGGGGGGGGSNPQPQTIAFAQAGPLTLPIGATLTNVASGGGGSGAITYQSSNTSVLTVNATSGLATGIAAGSATVTATKAADASFSQAQATYTVNVTLQQQTIAFAQPGSQTVQIGATLTNVASGGGGSGAITYQSHDTSVLTVNATTGVVTGVATGTTGVTATKAADATFAQAQAAYVVHVQTKGVMSAWIGATDTQVMLPQIAVDNQFGNQFWRAPAATCATPADIGTCANATFSIAMTPAVTDAVATLTQPAYYQLSNGASIGLASVVASKRFSERIGHAALFFNNRYWVLGGGQPNIPHPLTPIPHTTLSDVWSSADGKSWKLETNAAPWGPRWFHSAVVFNGAMWVIDGAPSVGPTSTDVWSSTDGVNWTKRTNNTLLPWHSTHLNIVVFNGAMWAVAGGSSFSSTDGVNWTRRSTDGAIGGFNAGRGYASLTVYNGSLWYIGGATLVSALPANALNDVWKSSNGVDWVQVTASAQFAKRIRHQAFVMNGRLWVMGGQVPDGSAGTDWARDAWSTTDGVQWTPEDTDGLDATYLARVVEQTDPVRVTLIGGIQRGYSNNVWQTTNGRDWNNLSVSAQFSPRSAPGVSFNGQMWIIGGGTVNGRVGDAKTSEIWRSANGVDWSRVTTTGTIFSPRDGHCAVVFQNKIWVIGGWDGDVGGGGTETRLNDVWSSSDGVAWTKHDPAGGVIFSPRVGHEVIVFANKLWVIAGNLTNTANSPDVWSSPDGLTWTQVSANVPILARNGHRGVEFNGEMWVTGGTFDNNNGTGTSDALTSSDGITWTQHFGSTLFASRMRHGTAVLNGRLYVIGGLDNEVYGVGAILGDVWSTADGTSWRLETAAGFTPRWNAGFMMHGGEMWLVGGFNLSYLNDVWRSTDGINWRVGVSQDIIAPGL